ncbi:MAG: prephenate dehydratase [Fibrobacteres bacterium]|nr:prephenate dehydratase [Fibrobacterota bacterium]
MKAAFQGVHGAYSELATRQLLGPRTQTLPCESFEDVFEAVAKGKAERGILPIENSLAGSIHQNYDLLLARDLHIVGEAHLKVEHVLMCHPSASLKSITQVRSHPQALAQCSGFFAGSKRIKPVVYFDTAGAAESLAKEAPAHIGAIASAYAAELYGLKVLKRNLQNQPNNFTRFLAVAKNPSRSARASGAGKSGKGDSKNPKAAKPGPDGYKTSIVFMPSRNQVGILFNILGVFALRDIDLLKIESRPNPSSPFEYWFYVDFAGASTQGLAGQGAGDPKVDQALDQLRGMASQVKMLGSYPAAVSAASGKAKPARRTKP